MKLQNLHLGDFGLVTPVRTARSDCVLLWQTLENLTHVRIAILNLFVPGTEERNREQEKQQSEKRRRQIEIECKAEVAEKAIERKRRERETIAEARRIAENDALQRRQQELESARIDESAVELKDHLTRPKLKRGRISLYFIVATITLAFVSYFYTTSTKSGAGVTEIVRSAGIRSKLKSCPSNGTVVADAYYDGIISNDTIVFDLLDGGDSSARRIDPVHLLLQFSDEIDLHSVRKVILARNGVQKFYISASDLRPLAVSYANGGRPWAFNNMPAALRTMSGSQNYGEWSGGFLGVMQKQAEDLNDFIEAWTGY